MPQLRRRILKTRTGLREVYESDVGQVGTRGTRVRRREIKVGKRRGEVVVETIPIPIVSRVIIGEVSNPTTPAKLRAKEPGRWPRITKDQATVIHAERIREKEIRLSGGTGLVLRSERVRFAKAADERLEYMRNARKRTVSIVNFEHICRKNLTPFFGHYAVSGIDLAAVQRFVSEQWGKGYKPRTIRLHLSTLRSVLGYQVELKRISRDHVPKMPSITVPREEPRYITPAAFLAAYDRAPLRLKAWMALGYYQCLRFSEALFLEWERVSFKDRTLRVANGTDDDDAGFKLKTAPSERTIRLHPTTLECLQAYQAETRFSSRYVLGLPPSYHRRHRRRPDGTVGIDPADPTMPTRPQMRHVWRLFCVAVGFPFQDYRSFRHTCTRDWFAAGMDLPSVMYQGGWRSSRIPSEIYAKMGLDVDPAVLIGRATPEMIRSQQQEHPSEKS